jgi:outer membrane protein assembly factor BamA
MGKLYISDRPPIDAIVSSDGSIYGGSALAFSDILGDHQFSVMAYQVREFRSFALGYLNQKRRFQYAINAFQYTLYYYPYQSYYDPALYSLSRPNDAIATRKITGASAAAYYPLSKFTRLEGSFGLFNYKEESLGYAAFGSSDMRSSYFINGTMLTATFSITSETTRFKQYGPAAGQTYRLSVAQGIPVTDRFISNTTWEADYRHYFYLGSDALLAFRAEGFMSRGRNPFLGYYGGNNQVRSAYYYSLIGTEYWFADAEFRFPLIGPASTLIGPVGPVRGVLFFDITRSKYGPYPAKYYRPDDDPASATFGNLLTLDAIGSFGGGIEFFLFGFPAHVEFAKRLEWASISSPFSFNATGSFATKFWIGFDF